MATKAASGLIEEAPQQPTTDDGGTSSASSSSSSPANLRSEQIRQIQLAARHRALARQAAAEAADWERECFNIQRIPAMATNLLPAQNAAKEARAAAERELAKATQCERAARKCHRQAAEDDFFSQMRAEAAKVAKATAAEDAERAAASEEKLKAKQLARMQARESKNERQRVQQEKQRAHWAELEAQRAKAAGGGKVEAAKAAEAVPSVEVAPLEAEAMGTQGTASGAEEPLDHPSHSWSILNWQQQQQEHELAAGEGSTAAAALTAARSRGEAAVEQILSDARSGALKLGQRLGLRLTDSKHGGFQVEPLAVFAPLATAWRRLSKDDHEEREKERAEATAEAMLQSLLAEDARLANRANLGPRRPRVTTSVTAGGGGRS